MILGRTVRCEVIEPMKENPDDGKVDESTRILRGDEGRKLKKGESAKDSPVGGQQPYWPGEGLRKPGEKIDGEDDIPIVR